MGIWVASWTGLLQIMLLGTLLYVLFWCMCIQVSARSIFCCHGGCCWSPLSEALWGPFEGKGFVGDHHSFCILGTFAMETSVVARTQWAPRLGHSAPPAVSQLTGLLPLNPSQPFFLVAQEFPLFFSGIVPLSFSPLENQPPAPPPPGKDWTFIHKSVPPWGNGGASAKDMRSSPSS